MKGEAAVSPGDRCPLVAGAAMLGSEMSLRLVALCVDANDPLGLARFWAVLPTAPGR